MFLSGLKFSPFSLTYRNEDLWSCSRIQDEALCDKPNIDLLKAKKCRGVASIEQLLFLFFSKSPLLHAFFVF